MLHIHRAERADALVDALADLLADALPDPFTPEVVAVPTRGMERWLTQRMSARLGATPGRADGVCANVEFPSPRRLVGEAIAAASGFEFEQDPWLPERSIWPLLEVIDACLYETWLERLAAHLGATSDPPDPVRRARRLGTARHIADLFGRYALYRPDMMRAWLDGENTDGAGRPLPADGAWQAELWRHLRERIAKPGPAERLDTACARLREQPAITSLPNRLEVFGLTRLPAGHLRVLEALADHRDVHLFLLHPSPQLWDAIAPTAPPSTRRGDDPTADLAANDLLASWGHDAREMQLVLNGPAERVDHHHAVEYTSNTLLARLQNDVRTNRAPAEDRPLPDPNDRTVQVHACHGRARQVEVLRDAILHELDENPDLEPRDIVVMCPDIETFAPLIQATFGTGREEGDGAVGPPALRVRLADRSVRQTNPVLAVVAELLDIAGERVTASQVLDLADREPVRRRFRFDDDALTRMREWVAESGIRWGLDAEHRAAFKLDAVPTGTWRFGLDRVLLGVAMTEDGLRRFESVLPLDDVDSQAIDLAGRFAELVDRLQASLDAFTASKPIAEWAAAIAAAADRLTATDPREDWQRAELQRLLDVMVTEATVGNEPNPTSLALQEVRALLAERLAGRPTRANFRTGHLTICTLVPMRSVPHRVVCLLGLDDGVFPRKAPRDGDDLMLDHPHVGDRDPRTEDRQLLLDALLAATDRLIITYTGNDERTNAPRPAAVPVGELLDVVDATVRTARGRARDQIVVRHPLQPFDPRNFVQAELVPQRRWSFDPVMLDGARALIGPRTGRGPFLEATLPEPDTRVIELDDLVRFAQHPVRAFLRQRLGIDVRDFSEEVEDDLPVDLDGLARWGVGQRLLDARLAGVDAQTARRAEIARGTLPPGMLGLPVVQEIAPIVDDIVARANALLPGAAPGSVDVRIPLADGRLVSGTVHGVGGDLLRTVTYSQVAPKHRITAWVLLVALSASYPYRPFTAATVGRAGRSATTAIRIGPIVTDPTASLLILVDLYDRGMREPLPLYVKTSAAYAAAGDPKSAWTSGFNVEREDVELEHQLVLGGIRTFAEVIAEPARPDESWFAAETTRFGQLAHRMWGPLLALERASNV